MTPLFTPTPLPLPTINEVFDAIERTRQFLGHQQNLAKRTAYMWVDGQPCFCIVAAITAACPTTRVRDAVMGAVRLTLASRWRSIEAYNDAPLTNVSDAKELLLRAKGHVGAVAA